ncbi:MAG: NMD3-related protein [Candidatus Aenigmatarchaeota archaeon]
MRNKFCPKCGRETDKFYGKVCNRCFLEKLTVVEKLPSKILLKKCKICGKVYYEAETFFSVESALDDSLSKILSHPEIASASYKIKDNVAYATLKIVVDDLEKEEIKSISIVFKSIICESCSKKHLGYFQSVIQLRAKEPLLKIISNEIEEELKIRNKHDPLAFISKTEKEKGGENFYIGSKQAAVQLSRNIKLKYKAIVKRTSKLVTSMKGKGVYRDTILISLGD